MPPYGEIQDRFKTVSDRALVRVAGKLGRSRPEDPTPDVVKSPFFRVSSDLREYLLEQHYWYFAEIFDKLEQYPGTVPFGYQFMFNFPPEFVSFTYLNDSGVIREGLRGWDIHAGKVVTNFKPVYCSYTSNVKDENVMSPTFFEAWCCRIATEICLEVTGDKDLKRDLEDEFSKYKMESIEVNYRNEGRDTINNNEYLETRVGILGNIGDFEAVTIPQTPIDVGVRVDNGTKV